MTNPLAYDDITPDNVGQFNQDLLLRSFHEIPQQQTRRSGASLSELMSLHDERRISNHTVAAAVGIDWAEEVGRMRRESEEPSITIPMGSIPSQTIIGRPVTVEFDQINTVPARVPLPLFTDEGPDLTLAQMEEVMAQFENSGFDDIVVEGTPHENLTPYQARLVTLRPELGDVWGNPTDPHAWHIVNYRSEGHVELGTYANEYSDILTPDDFRAQIVSGQLQLVYRNPELPGAELARLNIRTEAELTQAPPALQHRRAIRLRNQKREVENDTLSAQPLPGHRGAIE